MKSRTTLLSIVAAAALAAPAPARADAPKSHPVAAKDLPKGVKAPKGFAGAIGWTDNNGDNVLMLSDIATQNDDGKSELLQADLVAVANGKARTLRTIKDKVLDCEEDLTAEFIDDALELTDLDGDGVAEVTLAYRVSCKGDVSPDTIKLLVLENADKYILRGEDFFAPEPHKRKGGTFKPEPAAGKWPAGFLDHAKATWKKIVK